MNIFVYDIAIFITVQKNYANATNPLPYRWAIAFKICLYQHLTYYISYKSKKLQKSINS